MNSVRILGVFFLQDTFYITYYYILTIQNSLIILNV